MIASRSLRLALSVAAFLFVFTVFPTAAYADSPYVVQPGDTLSGIAARYSSSVEAIAAANNLSDPSYLAVGQTLTIPGAASADSSIQQIKGQPVEWNRAAPPASANSVLGNRRILSFYGHPNDGRMGILGQLDEQQLVAALKRRAAMYQVLSDRPVQPAIHFIVTVAQEGPGPDGKARARSSMSQVQEYSDLAAQNGMLMILDIQVGHSTVQEEIAPWIPLLRQPHVHLALDPEFDMWPGQTAGIEFGHMTADEINYAQKVLNEIVEQNGIPDKVLIVHQFTQNMVQNKPGIQSFPHVQFVTDMDGFGTIGLKLKHYEWYVKDELIEYAGIKLFFDQDTPLMTPEQVMRIDPVPDVIIYQ